MRSATVSEDDVRLGAASPLHDLIGTTSEGPLPPVPTARPLLERGAWPGTPKQQVGTANVNAVPGCGWCGRRFPILPKSAAHVPHFRCIFVSDEHSYPPRSAASFNRQVDCSERIPYAGTSFRHPPYIVSVGGCARLEFSCRFSF